MPLRAQYLADIGLHSNPYPAAPESRIAAIYGTARRGRISKAFASQLWQNHFNGIRSLIVGGRLPAAQPAFDNWWTGEALKLTVSLRAQGKGDFGIAQKMMNLFLKDLWAFGLIQMPIEAHLHAPIDRRVLGKFAAVPTTWNPWTKASASTRACPTVRDYFLLQQALRNYWRSSPIVFPSVIQMEQFFWHSIP
jgi:hypothetical protein